MLIYKFISGALLDYIALHLIIARLVLALGPGFGDGSLQFGIAGVVHLLHDIHQTAHWILLGVVVFDVFECLV